MNILYIHTHDTGRYLSPYGKKVPTEHVHDFAKDALVFRNAHCVSPTCSPSRGALLTGRYPHNNGLIGLAHRGFEIEDKSQHLASFLSAKGYETVLSGVQHENGYWIDKQSKSEDLKLDELGYHKVITEGTFPINSDDDFIKWDRSNASNVCDYLSGNHEKPFFISYGMFATHRNYPTTSLFDKDTIEVPIGMKDNNSNRDDTARFYTSLKNFDHNFDMVIKSLKKENLYDQTLIIFTTDHGLANPFEKCNLNTRGTGVSLIIRNPKCPKSHGKVTDALVSHLDVFPTICNIIKHKEPRYLQGKSMLPIFEDETCEINSYIFSEINFHTAYEPTRSVRTKEYCYIVYFGTYSKYNISNCDESPPKNLLLENGYSSKSKVKCLFFDLLYDPLEFNNLYNNREYSAIINKYEEILKRHMDQTNDKIFEEKEFNAKWVVNKNECRYPSIRSLEDMVSQ